MPWNLEREMLERLTEHGHHLVIEFQAVILRCGCEIIDQKGSCVYVGLWENPVELIPDPEYPLDTDPLPDRVSHQNEFSNDDLNSKAPGNEVVTRGILWLSGGDDGPPRSDLWDAKISGSRKTVPVVRIAESIRCIRTTFDSHEDGSARCLHDFLTYRTDPAFAEPVTSDPTFPLSLLPLYVLRIDEALVPAGVADNHLTIDRVAENSYRAYMKGR
ncbi:hypothetical protein MMC25_006398 [Agyrium rufum]|nr:hypothetical protein [Agyrium rufum]